MLSGECRPRARSEATTAFSALMKIRWPLLFCCKVCFVCLLKFYLQYIEIALF